MYTLPIARIEMSVWMPLLGNGIGLAITQRSTLESILHDQLSVSCDYLKHRIQTILVNSRAVDAPDQVEVIDGDVIALSAAMPGLVGATLRRGSHLSSMRREITHNQIAAGSGMKPSGTITLKLFNMVASELGPRILNGPFLLKKDDLVYLHRHYPALSISNLKTGPGKWYNVVLSRTD